MNFNILSKRRNVLMGLAIIAILLCHWKEWFEHNAQTVPHIAELLSRGTSGVDLFFMLSGFGLFYSFTKNHDALNFYRKRLVRLLPAYFAITTPYWIVRDILLDKKSVIDFLGDLFFVTFFSEGMRRFWFIPAIIIFYLLFPVIYYFIFGEYVAKIKSVGIKAVTMIVIAVLLNVVCSLALPFYDNISIMLSRLSAYIIGIYLGYLSYHNKEIKPVHYVIAPAVFIILYFVNRLPLVSANFSGFFGYYSMTAVAMIVVEICIVIFHFLKNERIYFVFTWLGGITLEAYIIHSALKSLFSYPSVWWEYLVVCVVLPIILGFFIHKVLNSKHKKSKSEK